MSIIAKKANPAEIDTPTTGKVSLYVDCNDGKIKIKDDSGCVQTLAYMGEPQCIMNIDVLVVGGGGAAQRGTRPDGAGYYEPAGGGGDACMMYRACVGLSTNLCVGCGGQTSNAVGGDSCFGDIIVHGGNYSCQGWSGNGHCGGSILCTCQGGGGAFSNGIQNDYFGGAGGDGCPSDISGQLMFYGAGGGVGFETTCACGVKNIGGKCGGGNAVGNSYNNPNGTFYGAGAGGGNCFCKAKGCGYQGVVIVRYKTDGSMGILCATGGTITCCNGYTIHTFTDTTQTQTFCITCPVPFYPVA